MGDVDRPPEPHPPRDFDRLTTCAQGDERLPLGHFPPSLHIVNLGQSPPEHHHHSNVLAPLTIAFSVIHTLSKFAYVHQIPLKNMSHFVAPKPTRTRPCKTLIVEDDEIAAHAMARLLASKGHEVQTAGSVGDALASLAWGPHKIILDLILPDGHGVTVLRRARKSPTHVPVAIVTAVQDPFAIDQITDLQPDAIFEKPVDAETLLKWVETGKSRKRTAS